MADPERRECARCRRQFAARMAVCPFCGHRVAGVTAPAGAPASPAAPARVSGAPADPAGFAAEAEQMFPLLRLMAIPSNFTPASLAAVDVFLDPMWGGRDGARHETAARFARVVELPPDHAHGWWYKQAAEERLGRREDRVHSLRRYLAVAPPGQRELVEKARELLAALAR